MRAVLAQTRRISCYLLISFWAGLDWCVSSLVYIFTFMSVIFSNKMVKHPWHFCSCLQVIMSVCMYIAFTSCPDMFSSSCTLCLAWSLLYKCSSSPTIIVSNYQPFLCFIPTAFLRGFNWNSWSQDFFLFVFFYDCNDSLMKILFLISLVIPGYVSIYGEWLRCSKTQDCSYPFHMIRGTHKNPRGAIPGSR